jgi:hypothetical protein
LITISPVVTFRVVVKQRDPEQGRREQKNQLECRKRRTVGSESGWRQQGQPSIEWHVPQSASDLCLLVLFRHSRP